MKRRRKRHEEMGADGAEWSDGRDSKGLDGRTDASVTDVRVRGCHLRERERQMYTILYQYISKGVKTLAEKWIRTVNHSRWTPRRVFFITENRRISFEEENTTK